MTCTRALGEMTRAPPSELALTQPRKVVLVMPTDDCPSTCTRFARWAPASSRQPHGKAVLYASHAPGGIHVPAACRHEMHMHAALCAQDHTVMK